MKTFSRRNFLKTSALMVPVLVPGAVLGKDGTTAPSNRITVGFAGIGCMNRGHLHGMLGREDAQVIAVSDPDQWRRETAKNNVEARYAQRRESGQFKGCDLYNSFTDMLHRSDIDGIVLATGENWQGIGTILCAKAGKHVYVEKPNALTIAEALGAIEAVRRHGTICQVGYQQRSWANFVYAAEVVRSGALGKIKMIYTRDHVPCQEIELPAEPVPPTLDWEAWVGPAPMRPFNHRFHRLGNPLGVVPWHFCNDFGLGNIGANASHAFDSIHQALGRDTGGPLEIIPAESGQVKYLTYKYPDDVTLQVTHGYLDPAVHEIPKGFDPVWRIHHHGALFVGENGWLNVGRSGYLVANPSELARNRPSRFEGHGSHTQNWLDCIKLDKRPKCDIDIGSHSTMVCCLGNIACWLKRPLKWDAAKNEFIGDDEANRYRSRAFRQPWGV